VTWSNIIWTDASSQATLFLHPKLLPQKAAMSYILFSAHITVSRHFGSKTFWHHQTGTELSWPPANIFCYSRPYRRKV